MTAPSRESVRVATDALRSEAKVWDAQAATAARIARTAEALRLDRVEAGLFQLVFSAYAQAAGTVVARAEEGSQRLAAVADTLVRVANTYQDAERANTRDFRGMG